MSIGAISGVGSPISVLDYLKDLPAASVRPIDPASGSSGQLPTASSDAAATSGTGVSGVSEAGSSGQAAYRSFALTPNSATTPLSMSRAELERLVANTATTG